MFSVMYSAYMIQCAYACAFLLKYVSIYHIHELMILLIACLQSKPTNFTQILKKHAWITLISKPYLKTLHTYLFSRKADTFKMTCTMWEKRVGLQVMETIR